MIVDLIEFAKSIRPDVKLYFYIPKKYNYYFAVCYNRSKKIYLNYDKIKENYKRDCLIQSKATILHEIGHIFYNSKVKNGSDSELEAEMYALRKAIELRDYKMFKILYDFWNTVSWKNFVFIEKLAPSFENF